MSAVRRAWVVLLAVAMMLLPTPATSEDPPPDVQDRGWGGGAPGGGCGYYPGGFAACPNGLALFYRCFNPYVKFFVSCL